MGTGRIILALDDKTQQELQEIGDVLGDLVIGGKITDRIDRGGISDLNPENFTLRFLDPKLHDIGKTMANRVRAYKGHADFVTVHASASMEALKHVSKVANEIYSKTDFLDEDRSNLEVVKVIAITLLSDISKDECDKLYGKTPLQMVRILTKRAKKANLAGVVCATNEVAMVRRIWKEAIIFVVGCRSKGAEKHDQKRTGTHRKAILDGADYLVCGREILEDPPNVESQIQLLNRLDQEVEKAIRDRELFRYKLKKFFRL